MIVKNRTHNIGLQHQISTAIKNSEMIFKKIQKYGLLTAGGNSQLYDYEEGGQNLSDTRTTLTVLDYKYLKMLEIYK